MSSTAPSLSIPARVAMLVGAVVLTGCGGNAAQAGGGNRQNALSIETAPAGRMSVQRTVDISGTLASPDQATVSSEAPGIVRAVLVELGRQVAVGQELVRLEPSELLLARERAESALRQTEAQLGMRPGGSSEPPPDEEIARVRTAAANRDDARATLARATQLVGRGLLPTVELDNAQTRAKVAEAAYQVAVEDVRSLKAALQDRRAALALAEKKVNDATIRAPVAGSISERLVQTGEFIRENTPVVTIVQMNPLKLRTSVQERHAGALRPGLAITFKVEPFPTEEFKGRLAYISPAVDQDTRSFAVEGIVDNPDHRLKPGLFAKGIVLTELDGDVIAVPEEAVLTFTGVSTVFVVEDGKVRQQVVSVGVHQDKRYEIVEGLKGDEVLATSSLTRLATGVAVQVGEGQTGAAQ